jgi:hypothetical protein
MTYAKCRISLWLTADVVRGVKSHFGDTAFLMKLSSWYHCAANQKKGNTGKGVGDHGVFFLLFYCHDTSRSNEEANTSLRRKCTEQVWLGGGSPGLSLKVQKGRMGDLIVQIIAELHDTQSLILLNPYCTLIIR